MFREINSLDNANWKANFAKNNGKTFNIEINGQTHTITPTNPAEFKNALNTLWKKAFIDNADFFDIIWANQNLRGSLFTHTDQVEAFTEFETMINSTNSKLYNFIKIE